MLCCTFTLCFLLLQGAPSFDKLARAAAQARERQDSERAAELYARALQLRPRWDEGLWYLGTLLYEQERAADARDALRRFVALRPDAGAGWALLGLAEYKTKSYDAALMHLQKGLHHGLGERADLARSAFLVTAALLTRAGRFDEAQDLLTDLVRTGESSEFLTNVAGLAALRMAALPASVSPANSDLVRRAGDAFHAYAASQSEPAGMQFRQLAADYPAEPGAHFLLGTFLLATAPEEGVKELRRVLELSPGHVPARIRLAGEYLGRGDAASALPLAREAVTLAPQFAAARLSLGEALLESGNLKQALAELETARKLAPSMARVHLLLGRAYSAAGRGSDARRSHEELRRLKERTQK